MRTRVWVAVCAGLASAALAPAATAPSKGPTIAPPPVAPERSTSSSGQFYIYYADATVRARLARKVEDIKSDWLERLGLKDEFKAPIILRLMTVASENSPRLSTSVYLSDGDELKIQIDVMEPAALKSADFDIEVYRALCLEYAYRAQAPKAGKPFAQPPTWLLEALYEDSMSADQGLPPALYDSLIERGSPPKLAEFLKERPMNFDATTRAIFRAQARGLLKCLQAQPKGAASLVDYLSRLPTLDTEDDKPLLACFPAFTKDPSLLTKAWVLSMADISATDRMKPLPVEETKNRLVDILNLTSPPNPKKKDDKPIHGPMAMPEVARSESGRYVLTQKAEDLLRLEVQAHPMLRPVIEEYRVIASELAVKPKKNMTSRLTQAGALLTAISEKSGQVADYLNWYEATKLETSSGVFADAVDNPSRSYVTRSDPISQYLDAIEVRGW